MKPSTPQGTRDFEAPTLYRRRYILDTIKNVFELYGFEPLETPALENIETLMGKYGDEGDKLIYKIRSNKNFLKTHSEKADVLKNILEDLSGASYSFLPHKSTQALRYDLTIPFARYVAMNQGKLTFPYKRYQIQPVWRGDRPQRSRYREFYQCDADMVGSTSLLNEVEFLFIYATVFEKLGIEIEIKINNRKILRGLFEELGVEVKQKEILIHIDKIDKIGLAKVEEELAKDIADVDVIATLKKTILLVSGTNAEKLESLSNNIKHSDLGKSGIQELEGILSYLPENVINKIQIDPSLARGLDYYTGLIVEVKAKNIQIGSIGGGGRYDDLTGLFGVPNIPGVGISFGVDRIYDVMEELNLFPAEINKSTTALFLNLGEKESRFAFNEMQKLREAGISCELFYESTKLDKQFKYATKKNIPFAIIIGSNEIAQEVCVVKDLAKGEQQTIPLVKLVSYFK